MSTDPTLNIKIYIYICPVPPQRGELGFNFLTVNYLFPVRTALRRLLISLGL